MRHRVDGRKFHRRRSGRRALFKNLVTALIDNGQIETSEAKARTTQSLVEGLVHHALQKNVASRRLVEKFLNRKRTTNRLVDAIAPQLVSRRSGFTRMVKIGRRRGDNALMARISWVGVKLEVDKSLEKKPVKKEALIGTKQKSQLIRKPKRQGPTKKQSGDK
ncbi:50S ribosomal protein L17 [Microgenomates group bacterium RIFCSPLOWO2_01_FULL_46_13]|nr:MAG: 50S ribosomal protein L17 [Microgenomates group bacterium RIFCSPHIGHO2_01_FULL_45_11]OGV95182.1 MAG: 50S ribosomal protein L17 [Microgenomates group bacterium RIFCSPLOWO2_01_FULL_46_13]